MYFYRNLLGGKCQETVSAAMIAECSAPILVQWIGRESSHIRVQIRFIWERRNHECQNLGTKRSVFTAI